jgi:hypothetical protein
VGVTRPEEERGLDWFSEVLESNGLTYKTGYSTSPQNIGTEKIHIPDKDIW